MGAGCRCYVDRVQLQWGLYGEYQSGIVDTGRDVMIPVCYCRWDCTSLQSGQIDFRLGNELNVNI